MTVTDAGQEPVVGLRFAVRVDDVDLGSFTSCEGLGCEVVLETREEGGVNGFIWQLPTRLKYSNVKLSRPLGKETQQVAKWFASMARGFTRRTAHIVAMTFDGKTVAEWQLMEVLPVRWTGPTCTSDQAKVFTETVEIAHCGFLDVAGRRS